MANSLITVFGVALFAVAVNIFFFGVSEAAALPLPPWPEPGQRPPGVMKDYFGADFPLLLTGPCFPEDEFTSKHCF
jgi:hypothetical protein